MDFVSVAVVGATGYSGEELVRLLLRHPKVELVCLTSRQYTGQRLERVYPKFTALKSSKLEFVDSDPAAVKASGATHVFLALPHGLTTEFAEPLLEGGLHVIDLSADFRIKDPDIYEEYYGKKHPSPELLEKSVYGMPELYRKEIRAAKLVASPGCYPTSIIIPLYPLLKHRLIDPKSIVITSLSGVSGAGRKAEVEYLFAECNESARAYGVPKHRHLAEIEQELGKAANEKVIVSFSPHLIPVNRGILTTIHTSLETGCQPHEISDALTEEYKKEFFVRLQDEKLFPDIKNVSYTNFIDITWRHDPRTGRIILLSAIDNLIKGASGQAIQSLNLMCDWPENLSL